MTQYSSCEPFNDDPEPWLSDIGRHSTPLIRPGWSAYTPRPEFDHPQTNPTNPVLTWAREVGVRTALDEVTFSSGSYLVGSWVGDQRVTSAHVVHARTVLTRLANLKEES